MIQPDKLTGYFWASFWRQLDGYVQIDLATVPSGLQYATASDSTPRCIVRSANKSSTSPRLFSSRARAPSPQAWQRKIALNTAQMETKSRPKDAHRGIERRVRYSASVGRPVDCAVGWPDSHTETFFGRLAYITVLSCHCTWFLGAYDTWVAWWRNGRTSDLWSRRREFDPRPGRSYVYTTTLGKLFTPMCLDRRRQSSLVAKPRLPLPLPLHVARLYRPLLYSSTAAPLPACRHCHCQYLLSSFLPSFLSSILFLCASGV